MSWLVKTRLLTGLIATQLVLICYDTLKLQLYLREGVDRSGLTLHIILMDHVRVWDFDTISLMSRIRVDLYNIGTLTRYEYDSLKRFETSNYDSILSIESLRKLLIGLINART